MSYSTWSLIHLNRTSALNIPRLVLLPHISVEEFLLYCCCFFLRHSQSPLNYRFERRICKPLNTFAKILLGTSYICVSTLTYFQFDLKICLRYAQAIYFQKCNMNFVEALVHSIIFLLLQSNDQILEPRRYAWSYI